MKKVLSILLCVVLLYTGAVVAFAQDTSVDGCNWMSVIGDDTSLADISMPGTHDTAATFVAFGIKARCQNLTVPEQLNCGARFLDIRLAKDGDQLKLVHNFIACRRGSGFSAPVLYFNDVIDYCLAFLDNNPMESIVMFAKKDSGTSDGFDALFSEYLSANPGRWYTENRIPTLGEVRGKIVLMNRFSASNTSLDDTTGGINLLNFPSQGKKEGSFEVVSLDQFHGPMISTYTVQDRYNYPKEDKWEKAIVPTFELERAKGELLINFLSTAHGLSPEINANYINANVMNYHFESGKSYGAVLFDFINEDVAAKIYNCNDAVRDASLSPAPSVPSEKPAIRNGFFHFLDFLWAWLIEAFSK